MSLMVIVLLAGLWASILLPGALRERRNASPVASVNRFERSMGILAAERSAQVPRGQPGRRVLVLDDPVVLTTGASTRAQARRRRRAVLLRLSAAVAVLGAAEYVWGGWLVVPFALSLIALCAYLAVLGQLQSRAENTRRVVRRLPAVERRPFTDAPAPLRRAAGQATTVRIRQWDG